MPAPPACFTARLLLTRALVPRSQTTILPATLAGSSTAVPLLSAAVKQRRSAVALAPGRPAACASMTPAVTIVASDGPEYVVGPRVTAPWPVRLCVPAATVVTHGLGWATVKKSPSLPAEADTKMPDAAALRNAISAGSAKFVCVPETE
jgi:hypothetical protein